MIDNLPVLRAKLKLTQKDLADRIGISHYSISGMEKGQRKMTWNTFMSVLPVFLCNEESFGLMRVFGIYTDELDAFLQSSSLEGVSLTDEDLDLVSAAGVHTYYNYRRQGK